MGDFRDGTRQPPEPPPQGRKFGIVRRGEETETGKEPEVLRSKSVEYKLENDELILNLNEGINRALGDCVDFDVIKIIYEKKLPFELSVDLVEIGKTIKQMVEIQKRYNYIGGGFNIETVENEDEKKDYEKLFEKFIFDFGHLSYLGSESAISKKFEKKFNKHKNKIVSSGEKINYSLILDSIRDFVGQIRKEAQILVNPYHTDNAILHGLDEMDSFLESFKK